jgi:hypothetical protein
MIASGKLVDFCRARKRREWTLSFYRRELPPRDTPPRAS